MNNSLKPTTESTLKPKTSIKLTLKYERIIATKIPIIAESLSPVEYINPGNISAAKAA